MCFEKQMPSMEIKPPGLVHPRRMQNTASATNKMSTILWKA